MSAPKAQTDYLGRKYAVDHEDIMRLLEKVGEVVEAEKVVAVVAVAETLIADAILLVARDRVDSHHAVDQVANDIKEYLTARLADRDQRRDQVGHG